MEKFIEWLEEDIKYINDISSKPLIMEEISMMLMKFLNI